MGLGIGRARRGRQGLPACRGLLGRGRAIGGGPVRGLPAEGGRAARGLDLLPAGARRGLAPRRRPAVVGVLVHSGILSASRGFRHMIWQSFWAKSAGSSRAMPSTSRAWS